MQFEKVLIEDQERYCFIMGKWEATVFTVVGRGKTAPDDEQAVRFQCIDGHPLVWVSDGEHMVYLETQNSAVPPQDCAFHFQAVTFKKVLSTKCKVAEQLYFPVDTPDVYVSPRRLVEPMMDIVDAKVLGTREEWGTITWDASTLAEVRQAVERSRGHEHGRSEWQTSATFGATMAAIAKATDGGSQMWLNPPATVDAPFVMRTEDARDSSVWSAVLMPQG